MIVACKGQKNGLSLFVGSYNADVECVEDQPFNDDGQCSKLVDLLLVGTVKLIFTRQISGNPYPGTVTVPVGGKKLSDGELFESEGPHACAHFPTMDKPADHHKVSTSKCTATVDLLNGDDETSSWRELWAGAVAVNDMCVKKGKAGMSLGHGRSTLLSPSTGTIELTTSDMQVPKVDYLLNWREGSGFFDIGAVNPSVRQMYVFRPEMARYFF